MSRIALLLALAACTLRPYDFGASATGTDVSTSTLDPTTGPTPTTGALATTSTTAASTTTTAATSSGDPPPDPDAGAGPRSCDQWLEDCPGGQKCVLNQDHDQGWRFECVPIVRDPGGVGDPCEALGSGRDTCGLHMICWFLEPDQGTCHALCTGTIEAPACADPDASCFVGGLDFINICYPACDPLAADCAANRLCIANPSQPDRFFCVLDASGDEGQTFDVCEYANACDPGLHCANPAFAAECDPQAGGCCLPFCDLTQPNTCPGAGQQCLPWPFADPAPPEHANLGACRLPE